MLCKCLIVVGVCVGKQQSSDPWAAYYAAFYAQQQAQQPQALAQPVQQPAPVQQLPAQPAAQQAASGYPQPSKLCDVRVVVMVIIKSV